MNRLLKVGFVSLLLAAVLGGTGCKTRPKNITAIPGSEGRGGTELVPSGPVTPGNGAGNTGAGPRGNTFNPGGGNAGPVDLNPPPVNPVNPIGDPTALPGGNLRDGMRENREMFKGSVVYFDYDKSAVKKAELAKAVAVAEYLKAHADNKLVVEGHCDERGTEGYNLALGERRALSVREVLVANGVGADRIVTESFGESRPADTGHDEAAWSKNRRSEFILLEPANAPVR